MKKKNILVDMSATILHYGHIRILKKASQLGNVIVGLTKDSEIKKYKGYFPEMSFNYRKEILESIKYVKKVIASSFYIDEKFLKKNKVDLLIHGNDNNNKVDKKKIKIFKRTSNISSTIIRKKALKCLKDLKKK
jgi:glycerol-3-phosphate cytidylyltransferase